MWTPGESGSKTFLSQWSQDKKLLLICRRVVVSARGESFTDRFQLHVLQFTESLTPPPLERPQRLKGMEKVDMVLLFPSFILHVFRHP